MLASTILNGISMALIHITIYVSHVCASTYVHKQICQRKGKNLQYLMKLKQMFKRETEFHLIIKTFFYTLMILLMLIFLYGTMK